MLAVMLYAMTRVQDPDLAMLALVYRVGEGLLSAVGIPRLLRLLWLARFPAADVLNAGPVQVFGSYLLRNLSSGI